MVRKSIRQIFVQIIFISLILGCSPQERLNRLLTKYPTLTEKDTIIVRDTITIEKYVHDTTTVLEFHDTTTVINNERVILKYFHDTLTKEIHHYVECKEDTVYVEKLVPIEKAVFRELSWWDKYKEFLYRILHANHHRTGNDWCIYPSYDFAHGQCDAIEAITHSICTLEFEQHRPLYDWFIDNLPVPHKPRQIEFSKLQPTYTLMSKRRLIEMVEEKHVDGWDDPRMSTVSGMRRRGYPAEALRNFCKSVGVTKFSGITDIALMEHSIREQLNRDALRRMVVLDPIKVTITNWPGDDHKEMMNAVNNPEDDALGSRKVPLTGTVYVERDDFMEDPPKKFYRLSPGSEVRLRYSYCIKCDEVIKDAEGNVIELKCSYDPQTLGKNPEGRKVRAAIHWVPFNEAISAEVRLYERTFTVEDPGSEEDWRNVINPDALTVLHDSKLEPSLTEVSIGQSYQFERKGYFCLDSRDSSPETLVFNRTIALRDSWAKINKK